MTTAIDVVFRQHYDVLGDTMFQLLQSKKTQEYKGSQIMMQWEYENMMTALRLALAARVSILGPFRALDEYLHLSQDRQRGLALAQMVQEGLQAYPAKELAGPFAMELVVVLNRVARFHLALKQYAAAEQIFLQELTLRKKQITDATPEYKELLAPVYHQLGHVAQEQLQWAQAEQYYQQALHISQEFEDRYKQANTYHSLGVVAQMQGQGQQAEQYYQQALRIFEEFDDLYNYEQARTYGQLGLLVRARGQWQQAQYYLLQALTIFVKYEDEYVGVTFHNLALLWLQRRERKLSAQVAKIVGWTTEKVEREFRKVLGSR